MNNTISTKQQMYLAGAFIIASSMLTSNGQSQGDGSGRIVKPLVPEGA